METNLVELRAVQMVVEMAATLVLMTAVWTERLMVDLSAVLKGFLKAGLSAVWWASLRADKWAE